MKSKLGISVGVLGALPFILNLFGGYTPLLLVVGYIFIREEDEWLRKTAMKALVLTVLFSVIYFVLGIIPDVLYIISDLIGIFGGYFYPDKIHSLFDFFQGGLTFIEDIVMILMAVLSLMKKSINIAPIDKLVD